jgi:hypothetical protein
VFFSSLRSNLRLAALIIYFLEFIAEFRIILLNGPNRVETEEEGGMKRDKSPNNAIPKPDVAPFEEQVRARAYELFEARGREEGHEFEDWLRAEEEIAARKSRASAA